MPVLTTDNKIPSTKENYMRFFEIKKNLTEKDNIEKDILSRLGNFSKNLLDKSKKHEEKKEDLGLLQGDISNLLGDIQMKNDNEAPRDAMVYNITNMPVHWNKVKCVLGE